MAFVIGEVRSLADANGHDPAIVVVMMHPDTEFVRDAKVVRQRGVSIADGQRGRELGPVEDVIAREWAIPSAAPAQND